MSHTSDAALAALTAAADGLLVPSESDYPLEPFHWDGPDVLTPATLLAALDLAPTTSVETRTLDAFFVPLTRVAPWMDAGERARAARFATLQRTIADHLADPVVYRVGARAIAVFLVGETANGCVVGLRTTVIET